MVAEWASYRGIPSAQCYSRTHILPYPGWNDSLQWQIFHSKIRNKTEYPNIPEGNTLIILNSQSHPLLPSPTFVACSFPFFGAPDVSLLDHPLWYSSITYIPKNKPLPWPIVTSNYRITWVPLQQKLLKDRIRVAIPAPQLMCWPQTAPGAFLSHQATKTTCVKITKNSLLPEPVVTSQFLSLSPDALTVLIQLTILSLKCFTSVGSLWHQSLLDFSPILEAEPSQSPLLTSVFLLYF